MKGKNGIGIVDRSDVLLRCPVCGRYREVSYVGLASYGKKGMGAVWRCGYCGSTFETGPELSKSLVEGVSNGYEG